MAVDWGQPVSVLDAYIQEQGLGEIVKPYYGVDQSDVSAMTRIIADEMGGQPIDLVIDDASHFLRETRASFNILFPHLAANGTYIIEDWGWAHWASPRWQDNGGRWSDKEPLSNLIFELSMLAASRPDLVTSVTVKPSYVILRKGYGTCAPGTFDISSSYLNRGKPVTLLT